MNEINEMNEQVVMETVEGVVENSKNNCGKYAASALMIGAIIGIGVIAYKAIRKKKFHSESIENENPVYEVIDSEVKTED